MKREDKLTIKYGLMMAGVLLCIILSGAGEYELGCIQDPNCTLED